MNSAPAFDPSAARAAAVERASAARAATVGLYAAARPAVAMAGLSSAHLVEFVGECEAGIRSLEAARTLALARLAATEEVVLEDGTVEEVSQGLGYRRLDAPDLVSEALGLSAQAAGSRVDDAVVLAAKLPALVDAMGAGRVDAYRAGIIADELRDAPRRVCDDVLRRIDGSLAQPGGVLRRRTRRALEVVDKDSLVTKVRRGRSALGLRMVPNEDSTDTWTAILPTEQSREAWAAVEPLAKQIRDTDGCTLDVARARAMTQLMLGNCSGTFHVHFAVPADQAEDFAARYTGGTPDPTTPNPTTPNPTTPNPTTPEPTTTETPEQGPAAESATNPSYAVADDADLVTADSREDPVVVTGLGTAGTTIVPTGWLADILAGRHGVVEADVIGCDPITGGFVTRPIPLQHSTPNEQKTSRHWRRQRRAPNLATDSYQPTEACRAYVKARDQHCRFPGCSTSVYFCDLDHVRAWPAGPSDPANLACLCRRHHRIKQRPGWAVRLNPDGSMDWTDPTGTTRTTHPVDHLGTTLPTADEHTPVLGTVDFGDAHWDGDYQDPDAYTGGIPLWLHGDLDLKAGFRAYDEWQDLPLAQRYPHIAPELLILHDEASWANEWLYGPPEPQPTCIRWIAS